MLESDGIKRGDKGGEMNVVQIFIFLILIKLLKIHARFFIYFWFPLFIILDIAFGEKSLKKFCYQGCYDPNIV
jgi:hypothetical protein